MIRLLGEADHNWDTPFIGKERAHRLVPLREVYDSGVSVTLSSDWNVDPLSPLASISKAVKLKNKGLPNLRAG
ncbi:MAG: putative amidohydrolase YtcJ [Oleiphilaceae bacterium]|jgi:predicted amidohydrolase YtcJ